MFLALTVGLEIPIIGYGKRSDVFLANGLLRQLFANPMQLQFL